MLLTLRAAFHQRRLLWALMGFSRVCLRPGRFYALNMVIYHGQ